MDIPKLLERREHGSKSRKNKKKQNKKNKPLAGEKKTYEEQ
jgi:hypothetical protein